jgi:predicted amidohydrolase
MSSSEGSCIAAPDGSWIVDPKIGKEGRIIADIDRARVNSAATNRGLFFRLIGESVTSAHQIMMTCAARQ